MAAVAKHDDQPELNSLTQCNSLFSVIYQCLISSISGKILTLCVHLRRILL
jgi:hypothetical protein